MYANKQLNDDGKIDGGLDHNAPQSLRLTDASNDSLQNCTNTEFWAFL